MAPEQAQLTKEQREAARKQLQKVPAIMDEYRAAAHRIRRNSKRSSKGKQSRLSQFGQQTVQRLLKISENCGKGLDAHIAQLQVKPQPSDPPGNEIVRELHALDELRCVEVYLSRAADGADDELM